ncbi:phage terminase large subunit family protein [Sulfitobacter sp. W074]|uniref:phage terminase large subunit family protein n=1 Tax=Sulfitobacter sp. W074 TaxID=2867026 RepID=UPI0021A761CB|nr:phage terminase large subunit family protein [Sulfitobacter sp. W074]UWR38384.1 phage terminase large subunit family protein [Sulfitobacter sp. W074]
MALDELSGMIAPADGSLDEKSWSVSYDVLMGNPGEDGVWIALDGLLKRTYEREVGNPIPVAAVAIDSGGHHASIVTNFCMPRQKRRVWAIKGSATKKGKRLEYVWPRAPKTHRNGCPIHSICTGGIKDRVEMHLGKTDPGPGYMHIPASRDKTWYDQFISEHRVFVDLGGGRMGSFWTKKRGKQRNEAWDCRVYALAAL